MGDILDNIEDYSKKRKGKILIVFDDMISHVMSDKKLNKYLKNFLVELVEDGVIDYNEFLEIIKEKKQYDYQKNEDKVEVV